MEDALDILHKERIALEKKREVESVEVRGICATIQAMKYPSFTNLEDLLLKFGYRLTKI